MSSSNSLSLAPCISAVINSGETAVLFVSLLFLNSLNWGRGSPPPKKMPAFESFPAQLLFLTPASMSLIWGFGDNSFSQAYTHPHPSPADFAAAGMFRSGGRCAAVSAALRIDFPDRASKGEANEQRPQSNAIGKAPARNPASLLARSVARGLRSRSRLSPALVPKMVKGAGEIYSRAR